MAWLKRWLRTILFFPLTRMIVAITAIVSALILETISLRRLGDAMGWLDRDWFVMLSGAAGILTACLVYAGYVRVFERRATAELSTRAAGREFAAGTALGSGLFTATVACLWLGGWYRLEGFGSWPSAMVVVQIGLVPAFVEEIIIRGVLFRITEESLGTWIAVTASALLFGLLHILNPGATLVATLCIALEAGVLLALAFVMTRRLWLPIGLHFGWNFTQGGIFGLAVSGGQSEGLLRSTLAGPELLSGGAFGAEASLFAVLVCGSLSIYLISRARREDRLVRPFWSRPLEPGESLVAGEQAADATLEV
ncbi:MAG: CPBP family intramembrane glutamic endopeptidase [Isosphaeraceae bacterium]